MGRGIVAPARLAIIPATQRLLPGDQVTSRGKMEGARGQYNCEHNTSFKIDEAPNDAGISSHIEVLPSSIPCEMVNLNLSFRRNIDPSQSMLGLRLFGGQYAGLPDGGAP